MGTNTQYDVGIFGLWYGRNYGSIITYYALHNVVQSLGYTTAMIDNPIRRESFNLDKLSTSHPLRFAAGRYETTPLYRLDEMNNLNNHCKAFLLGSDQLWNYGLSRNYRQSYFFDFVDDDRLKISYGTSFGKYPYNGPAEDKPIVRKNLGRFNAVSVRDDFSKRIAEEEFGVSAEQVLDPVFLCPRSAYDTLIDEKPNRDIPTDYIFAYLLDPNPVYGKALQRVADVSGKNIVVAFDEPADKNEYYSRLEIDDDRISALMDPPMHTWLAYFRSADYILTDSFHGACFSVIFEKDFIVLKNDKRGGGRFKSLLGSINLEDRIITKPADFSSKFEEEFPETSIDYNLVHSKLDPLVERGKQWLVDALAPLKNITIVPKERKSMPPAEKKLEPFHPDIQRCKMVAALLRDYGIKHVVASSGARDVTLVRLFEENDCFTTYNVADERSAAYYALGLALQLNEPVAITCTSGTAVSNYLPGITEAYHMQVPIAVISGDRYPYFLGQMEAQKTDHLGALQSVTKMSVELPIGWDGMLQWDSRRKISEALLEMTHHGAGPVHINVPMAFLETKYPTRPDAFDLPRLRHISRIDAETADSVLEGHLAELKKAERILVISGQDNPLNEEQQKAFDDFCSKYNVCVVTDHLSNLHGEYTLNPYNLLRKVGPRYFIDNLMPDLVLYIGGKRVLNCPLQGKMRSIPRTFDFWRIDADGKVADLYRTLTHVWEMTPTRFFRYFADRAGESVNSGEYYKVWKDCLAEYPQVDYKSVESFNAFYTIGGTMARMPKNSILHLGVGTAFHRAHFFDLDPSVQVHCNMGTNGIDGSASAFMAQAYLHDGPAYLFIGDLSFFYDMNSVWNKPLTGNLRILLNNDFGAGFLRNFGTGGITHEHSATAKAWVESLGFTYLSARTKKEFEKAVKRFTSDENKPMFFENFVV